MRFALDADERFWLTARGGGWELEVDGGVVHYCRDPLGALRYMADELMAEAKAEGVREVVTALDRIDKTLAKGVEVVDLQRASVELKRVLSARLSPSGSRREHVRHTSLALAGCTEPEFKGRPDAKDLVAKAKAILEPWFDKGTE